MSTQSFNSTSLSQNSPNLSHPNPNSNNWEQVRKSARKVETQIFSKLIEYNKLTTSYLTIINNKSNEHSIMINNDADESDEKTNLIEKDNEQQQQELEIELTSLLSKLSSLNENLSSILSNGDENVNTESNQYTLSRNQAIYHDYNAEFNRIQQLFQHTKTRAELFGQPNRSTLSSKNQLRTRTDQLVKEKSSIQQSLKLADDVIQQALDSRESLHNSNSILKSAQRRISQLTRKFPIVNKLMSNITTAKQREMVILSVLIGSLMCFTLVYIMNKA